MIKPKKSIPFLMLSLTILFFLAGCKKEKNYHRSAEKMPPALASYIYAYTSGMISKDDPIRIRFVNPMVDESQVNQEASTNLITLRPKVKGTSIWEDTKTLVFQPDEWLKSGTNYLGTLKIRELVSDLHPSITKFEFDFKTKDQYVDVKVEGLSSASMSDLSQQKLEGFMHTGDILEEEDLSKILTVTQGGKELAVNWSYWNPQESGYAFVVEGVQRMDDESTAKLIWNGQSAKINSKGELSVPVSSLNNFVLTNVEIVNGEEPHLIAYFSDPLRKNQDLNGMFSFTESDVEVTTVVDRNRVKIYPSSPVKGMNTLIVNTGIENINGKKLSKNAVWNVEFIQEKPQVNLVGSGSIIPDNNGLIFPFEAIGLNAVDIEVFKIYDNNILQFLQTNNLEGSYQMERVGDVVFQQKYLLSELNPKSRPTAMMRYAVDLKKLVDQDPGAIYQIRIGFKQEYAEYACGNSNSFLENNLSELDNDSEIVSIWENNYRYYSGYRWKHREDPCYPAYYRNQNFVRRNVLASNVGLMAKRGKNDDILLIANDLRTTNPLPDTKITLYNYAQQEMGIVVTNSDGIAKFENIKKDPFVAVATYGGQNAYLKLFDQNALSLSRFDVAGVKPQKGLKGFIYGERGVWRPGDSLYLNFVLEDETGKLPADHPIKFILKNPRGQVHQQFTTTENVKGVYPLHVKTSSDDPTGNWRAQVLIGGAKFAKNLKIETVKPNRLKIDLDFGKEELTASDNNLNGSLQVNWLHGAPAKNLKATVETKISAVNTTFSKYKDFEFDDPARKFSSEPKVIFDDKVNAEGHATVTSKIGDDVPAPGKLRIAFKSRAFENGGDFSFNNFTMPYNPYNGYVGINIPRNEYNSKRLDMNKDESVEFVVVDVDGKPISNANLDIGLYRVEWRWWWDRHGDSEASQYNTANHTNALSRGTAQTNSRGLANYTVNVDDWGRYMIRACDQSTGHCTGDFFYAGYPWYDDDDSGMREAAAMLHFTTEKEKYNVGEDIVIKVPASEASRCLIAIENGTEVIKTIWKEAKAGQNIFKIKATPEMTPNIYVNVTLLQPHGQSKNDLGIRMYGVVPVTIENETTVLEPKIAMPDELEPEGKFKVTVSETNNQPMVYTVAVVDDGLLDLTNFKTPNPWNVFYAREALGVNTWDMYDYVLGAFGDRQNRILSIGGDGENINKEGAKKANRFKPVVLHLGPFYLEAGQKATHELTMPNYVGSVRTMVVASGDMAYGKTEKTTPVEKPLMILATLPRVLGPTENLTLPVNVFAMDDHVKNVNVTVKELSGLGEFVHSTSNDLTFSSVGDQITTFDLKMANKLGVAKFLVTATSGKESASQEIEIDVRNPNPVMTNVYDGMTKAGETWSKDYELIGMPGTNNTIMEVSSIPPLNLGKRLDYLIRYPHGCIEQTTSAAFPQLFVHRLLNVTPNQRQKMSRNIGEAIRKLRKFQRNDGNFTYWPGDSYYSDYGNNYAGHFLLEAKEAGYAVPPNMLNNWLKAQSRLARSWRVKNNQYKYSQRSNYLIQAYRLYTLALAKVPDWGAMNRLRDMDKLPEIAKWRLALAYAVAGKPEIANGMIANLSSTVKEYTELNGSYGSNVRDEAMILETLAALKKEGDAVAVMRSLAGKLSKDRWYSTQTTAYSLLAIAKFIGDNPVGKELKFSYQTNGGNYVDAGATTPMMQIDLGGQSGTQSINFKNKSNNLLFVRVIQSGQPVVGDLKTVAKNLNMEVNYYADGKKIDPARITQGTDFTAKVTITNPGTRGRDYDELALTQIFPSGWEIQNSRLSVVNTTQNNVIDYQDIRDDRVYTYFDMKYKSTVNFEIQLNAAYPGRYFLPNTTCEAMYDNLIQASEAGMWVEVVKDGAL